MMKLPLQIIFLLLFIIGWYGKTNAQQLPVLLQQVLKNDTSYNFVSCKINIHVDVPGLKMPDKMVEIILEKGKPPKIKGSGMIIFPKQGIIGQYRDFLDLNCQAIPIDEIGDTVKYKLVSLDKSTDWITVDLSLSKKETRVHKLVIATRKNGEFIVNHHYNKGDSLFPETTIISFESMPVKFPLKFMGQSGKEQSLLNSDVPVCGKVRLRYSDLIIK
jgi:hypothetical protein